MISKIGRGQFRQIWAAAVLTSLCCPIFAQGTLQFTSPPNETEVLTGIDVELSIDWRAGDHPVSAPVTIETTLGVPESQIESTDRYGLAVVTIRSDVEGTASIVATGGTESGSLTIHFVDTIAGATELPFGGRSLARVGNRGQEIRLATDRIGFLGIDGFELEQIQDFIDANDIAEVIFNGGRNYTLLVGGAPRLTDLRELARRLQNPPAPMDDGSWPVRKAGLVAAYTNADQQFFVPDEVIVKFIDLPTAALRADIEREFKLTELKKLGRNAKRFISTIDQLQSADPITLAAQISDNEFIKFAEPNYVVVGGIRTNIPDDPGFKMQWHHENNGDYATDDADIDSASAFAYSKGNSSVLIAVIDRSFDITHPDLTDNLWTAPNGLNGIDLVVPDLDPATLLSSSGGFDGYAHGTRVAGVVGARGDNGKGYAGSCPQCRLLLIRTELVTEWLAEAFDEAIFYQADIATNSWGWFGGSTTVYDAMDDAVNAGITVVMAMSNTEDDNCGAVADTSSRPNVIAVSGSTDFDLRSPYSGEAKGFGTCMDVLAPTRGGVKGIHTTSVEYAPTLPGGKLSTYWHDFSGTSAATPLAAGIVGLLKSVNPLLSPIDAQRVLQDTADRIDPANATYSSESGFSDPTGIPTHGYGRVNSFEAVRLLAPKTLQVEDVPPGRGGRDLLVRDNELDWGNTEQPSNTIFNAPREQYSFYKSVDIKIDAEPFQPLATTPVDFVNLVGEEPEVGQRSRAYVRTRNRGPEPVASADVKLHIATVTDDYPDLPNDFWSTFPGDSSTTDIWHPFPSKNLLQVEYSGPSVAGCPGRIVPECLPLTALPTDVARILSFEIPAMDWDESAGQRLAILVAINSADDPLQAKPDDTNVLTTVNLDNNVTLWVSGDPPPVCDSDVLSAILILLAVLIIILLYIILLLLTNQPIPSWLYFFLAILLFAVILIYILYPVCLILAINSLPYL